MIPKLWWVGGDLNDGKRPLAAESKAFHRLADAARRPQWHAMCVKWQRPCPPFRAIKSQINLYDPMESQVLWCKIIERAKPSPYRLTILVGEAADSVLSISRVARSNYIESSQIRVIMIEWLSYRCHCVNRCRQAYHIYFRYGIETSDS